MHSNGYHAVFTLAGEFVAKFELGLDEPESIDIDEDGYVYVISIEEQQLKIF